VCQLQTYLGMINFYRRFLPGAAGVLKPLTDALRGSQQAKLAWTAEMAAAFHQSKSSICAAAELAHPVENAAFFLAVDASSSHVGAGLQEEVPGQTPRPLAFFSAKLSAAQAKYSAFDRELLACYLAIRHFRWYLEGRVFYILSDHKPLTFALHRLSDPWSDRQQRQLAYIAEYMSDIRHVPGKSNVVADTLSRPAAAIAPPAAAIAPPAAAIAPPAATSVDFGRMAELQAVCEETAALARDGTLQVRLVQVAGQQILCDTADGRIRPLVPANMRKEVFLAVNGQAHPGTRATRRLLSSR
jgi:cleavage and polyadenylation specificity factor subunit 1